MAAFPEVQKITFEGPQSKNPLAFRYYEENRQVAGKTMKDQLRFSVAYWHTMRGTGGDPFGPGTMLRPWEAAEDSVDNAIHRVRVAFEFMEKLGAPFFCFHDRDMAPEGRSLAESNRNLDAVVKIVKQEHGADRHQAALGHGQLVQQPALRARRRHQPQRRRLRLRRRPGEKGPRSDQGAGRRRLRVLGRPRRLPDPLEHRHEARGRTTWPASCTWRSIMPSRSASRASSTSSPSPRSRPSTSTISTRPPASTSSAPTTWPTT